MIEAILSEINSYLGYLSYFRSYKVINKIISKSYLPYIFDITFKKAKIKNYMVKTAVWGWEPPKYEQYENGIYRIFFDPQLVEVVKTHIDMETEKEVNEVVLEYHVKYIEKDLPKLTIALRDNKLEAAKILLQERIKAYDSSTAVNEFYFGENSIWLDKLTRIGLVNSINVEKESGFTESALWYNNECFNINCDKALEILKALELYAIECYNKTAEHYRNASLLTTEEELDNYDYREGYPEKLTFTL